MIGDSYAADIAGALRSGIDALWYNPAGLPPTGDLRPQFTVRTLDEIREIL